MPRTRQWFKIQSWHIEAGAEFTPAGEMVFTAQCGKQRVGGETQESIPDDGKPCEICLTTIAANTEE